MYPRLISSPIENKASSLRAGAHDQRAVVIKHCSGRSTPLHCHYSHSCNVLCGSVFLPLFLPFSLAALSLWHKDMSEPLTGLINTQQQKHCFTPRCTALLCFPLDPPGIGHKISPSRPKKEGRRERGRERRQERKKEWQSSRSVGRLVVEAE